MKIGSFHYIPQATFEILEEKIIPETGFLKIKRAKVKLHYENGEVSPEFEIDTVKRLQMNAVVILAHFDDNGVRKIYLRSAIRPALALDSYDSELPEENSVGNQWEIPAGFVEPEEKGVEGLKQAASRELMEELGFNYTTDKFNLLGKRIFSAIGLCSERLFFFEIEVNPEEQKQPTLDGHPFEENAAIITVPLEQAVNYISQGYLPDSKTEVGILRLARKYLNR